MAFNDKEMGIARVYARSLLSLAQEGGAEGGKAEELQGDLAAVVTLADESPEVARLLGDPLVGSEERRRVIERAFRGKASDLLVDALQVVARKGRLALLPAIAESFRLEHQKARGIVDVFVTTAVPLSDALRSRLTQAIASRIGMQCHLIEEIDPDILGGLVVRVGDQKIDTSVARELGKLSEAFRGRASREILSGKAYTAEEGP